MAMVTWSQILIHEARTLVFRNTEQLVEGNLLRLKPLITRTCTHFPRELALALFCSHSSNLAVVEMGSGTMDVSMCRAGGGGFFITAAREAFFLGGTGKFCDC